MEPTQDTSSRLCPLFPKLVSVLSKWMHFTRCTAIQRYPNHKVHRAKGLRLAGVLWVGLYIICVVVQLLVVPGTGIWGLLEKFSLRGANGFIWLVGKLRIPVLGIQLAEIL